MKAKPIVLLLELATAAAVLARWGCACAHMCLLWCTERLQGPGLLGVQVVGLTTLKGEDGVG